MGRSWIRWLVTPWKERRRRRERRALDRARKALAMEQAEARQRLFDEAARQRIRDAAAAGQVHTGWADEMTSALPAVDPAPTLGQETLYQVPPREDGRQA